MKDSLGFVSKKLCRKLYISSYEPELQTISKDKKMLKHIATELFAIIFLVVKIIYDNLCIWTNEQDIGFKQA